MKFSERTKTNKVLFVTHFVVTVAVPLLVVFIALDAHSDYAGSSFWTKAFRGLFFFIGLPVYFVYASKILLEKFPANNILSIIMLGSVIWPIIYSLFSQGENFFVNLQLAGLNVYLGLNILFSLGMLQRVFGDTKKGNLPLKIIMLGVISILFFYAPAYLLGYSFYLTVDGWSDYEGLARFFLSILIIVITHFKLLRKMAKEEKI